MQMVGLTLNSVSLGRFLRGCVPSQRGNIPYPGDDISGLRVNFPPRATMSSPK